MKQIFFFLLVLSPILFACDDNSNDDDDDNNNDDNDDDNNNDDDTSQVDDDSSGDDDSSPVDDDSFPDDDDDNNDNDNDDNNDDNDDLTPPENAVFVDGASGNDANPGSADLPKKTLNAGLALGQTENRPVVVAQGVYEEESYIQAVHTSLFGGYRASDWKRNIAAYETTLKPTWPLGLSVFNEQEEDLRLDGLTIVGPAGGEDETSSTAVSVRSGNIRITRNRIRAGDVVNDNSADSFGIKVDGSVRLVVEDNEITSGIAISKTGEAVSYGIAISDGQPSITIRSNRITSNLAFSESAWAWSIGVAVAIWEGPVLVADNDISAGEAISPFLPIADGFEVYYDGDLMLVNNRISGGDAPGGFSNAVRTYMNAESVILIGNLLTTGESTYGGGAYFQKNATLVNNIVYAAESDFTYALRTAGGEYTLVANDLKCGTTPCFLLWVDAGPVLTIEDVNQCGWDSCFVAEGNFAAEPEFNPAAYPHLQVGSPCIDAGVDPTFWYDGSDAYVDMDGETRPSGDAFDVGPDEWMGR